MSEEAGASTLMSLRYKVLQEERLYIQKKTFTKWINSILAKEGMEVLDLFVDLADGKKLIRLLEIITGAKLPKPNNGRLRVHKIENVNKAVHFVDKKVWLEGISAEDIVDGNPTYILGFIWQIYLRIAVRGIIVNMRDDKNETREADSPKDILLLWCQNKINGYRNVNIQDFSESWRNGLGFNALIHAHRPDLIEFEKLMPSNSIENLVNAFTVAEQELGVVMLLDAEDCDILHPDEKSVMMYVSSFYQAFAYHSEPDNVLKSQQIDALGMEVNPVSRPPDFDALKSELARLESFSLPPGWPIMFIRPEDCALAGFFFLQDGDKVQCAFCRGIAGEWDHGDTPLVEHHRHFPKCPFICGLPVGNIAIHDDDKEKDAVSANQILSHSTEPDNVLKRRQEIEELWSSYEQRGQSLLEWIKSRTANLNSRDFPADLEGLQTLFSDYTDYLVDVKPSKYKEKKEIKEMHDIINMELKQLSINVLQSPEKIAVDMIDYAWEEMERSEHQHWLALRVFQGLMSTIDFQRSENSAQE